jgi:hypothetical protein
MLLIPQYEERLERLSARLRLADAATPVLLSETVAEVCPEVCNSRGSAARLDNLEKATAWTEWSLELIRLGMPAWQIRRLVHEDGIWLCSLSKHPNLPLVLDDVAEVAHENLPLAVLSAMVEARRKGIMPRLSHKVVPHIHPAQGHAICCDNFA